MRAARRLLPLALAAGLLFACGYRPPGLAGIPALQRLHVAPFLNETFRPGVNTLVAEAVLRRLQLDHRVAVVEEGRAEAVLAGAVRQYENQAVAFERAEIGRRFRVRLFVGASLRDRQGGPTLRHELAGEAYYTAAATVTGTRAAEEDAVRRAAEDAAERLLSILLYERAAGR